jgi:thymidylate synthase (FAD)
MAFIARVSNPSNQNSENYSKLLAYCIKHNHWSVFEQSSMTLEIETNRGIAAQILRHRSFTFQEFSQRYADTNLITENIPIPDLRKQDTKNRQNSTNDLGDYVKLKFQTEIAELFTHSNNLYKRMLEAGVAKECARFVLPLATPTRIYMTGSCRSWVHYINLRSANGTQKEHMDIALACKEVFKEQFPSVSEALEWV